jgi:hypothetical protein
MGGAPGADHFPNDAQDVPDEEWMRFGLRRDWYPLHKDWAHNGP